ncbi:hypothetical protein B4N89_41675 [Embleya scabrispora]|uniref:Uncharacterized protein n=1 Tax=Embleya scabrispora TaxID=159449 RepID=A0A1T3NK46_9ACTN|nr:hypothetical protein [Embleya scabrispora]OPC77080.1 hypothetical protein B4N89_41675 [Embleya scabrispora]
MIALCLLVVGGCSRGPAHRGDDPLPAPFDGAAVASPEQERFLHESEERAVAACMRQRGLSYREVPAGRAVAENPYGLLTETQAARNGYGLTADLLAGPPDDPNAELLARLDPEGRAAWRAALTGTGKDERTLSAPDSPDLRINTDGCVYLGRMALYGSEWEQAALTVAGLTTRVIDQVLADPGFRSAQRRWADCMRANGEQFATLQDARGAIQNAAHDAGGDRVALQAVGRRELRLAERDAACQRQSDLPEAVRTAQKRVEAALPASSRRQAAELADLRKRALGPDPTGHRREPSAPKRPATMPRGGR